MLAPKYTRDRWSDLDDPQDTQDAIQQPLPDENSRRETIILVIELFFIGVLAAIILWMAVNAGLDH